MIPTKTALALSLTGALAACDIPLDAGRSDDGALRNISPAALAALPAGMSPGFLIRDRDGCYGVAVEQNDPPTGIALLDANGQQVCDT